jgi:hypothetical protein
MNCEMSRALIELSAEEIPGAAAAELRAHLQTCPACRKVGEAQRLLLKALQAASAPDMPAATSGHVLGRVFALDAQRRRRRLSVAAGLAATLLLGLALGVLLAGKSAPDYTVQNGVLMLPSERPTVVGIAFTANATLENVQFTIDLPDGVQVDDQPDFHRVSWMGELRKGQNLVKLPLLAHRGAQGVLRAELDHGTEHREFTVPILAQETPWGGKRLWQSLRHTFDWYR